MDYRKIYDNLCLSRKYRGCDKESGYEVHHILPRSMGGGNEEGNLVKLTYKEHYLAHKLLFYITTGSEKVSMGYALRMMSTKNSRSYEKTTTFFKYTNKIPVRDIEGYVYAKTLKFDNITRLAIRHKDFNKGTERYRKKLSAIFLICKSFIKEGAKGFTSVHRSKWKPYILDLENKGYITSTLERGSKFYKFNKDMFYNVYTMECKLFNLSSLISSSELGGVMGNLLLYNSKNISKSLYIERSYVKGKYFIMPVYTGWVPSDKPLLTKSEIITLLKKQ